jgi:hypothetical protein
MKGTFLLSSTANRVKLQVCFGEAFENCIYNLLLRHAGMLGHA